jgi:hypothetical protein
VRLGLVLAIFFANFVGGAIIPFRVPFIGDFRARAPSNSCSTSRRGHTAGRRRWRRDPCLNRVQFGNYSLGGEIGE